MRNTFVLVALCLLLSCPAAAQRQSAPTPLANRLVQVDDLTIRGSKHFVHDYAARTGRGTVNVVVEIPAGTNAKWEVDADDGQLKWEIKDGAPRIVKYLPYLGNYGMIPQTLLAAEAGGDGDPLDVLVLGPAVTRGTVIEARVIGVLRFLDKGEQDDKLLAVMPGSPLGSVLNLDDLERDFAGALQIVEIWFSNYKGPGVMTAQGRGNVDEANAILDAAIAARRAVQAKP